MNIVFDTMPFEDLTTPGFFIAQLPRALQPSVFRLNEDGSVTHYMEGAPKAGLFPTSGSVVFAPLDRVTPLET